MTQLVLATHNAHKVDEFREILPSSWQVLTLADRPDIPDPIEDGATFEANALIKARAAHAATGLPALADDSGLCVAALGGAPGVHSKRYSPEGTSAANNALLLAHLDGATDRSAAFVCVLALVTADFEGCVRGESRGHIALTPHGDGGFGYDPLFVPEGFAGRTFAELTSVEKHAISHRGRASAELPGLLARARLAVQNS
jgi:XTP/dITP diphosphohydrolase